MGQPFEGLELHEKNYTVGCTGMLDVFTLRTVYENMMKLNMKTMSIDRNGR